MKKNSSKFHFDNSFEENLQQYGAIQLYQIGDLYCEGGYEVATHHQTYHEITYVTAGSGVCTFNKRPFRVGEGAIFLSPKGSEHSISSSRYNPLRYFYCAFKFDHTHPNYVHFAELEKLLTNAHALLAMDQYTLDTVFALLFRELQTQHKDKDVLIEAGLTQLLLLTRRCFEENNTDARGSYIASAGSKKQRLVRQVVQYIDSHIFHIKNLSEISDELDYSYSYITQVFSSTMGVGLNAYYREKRMKKAEELLQQNVPVTRVAEVMGFDTVQSFSRSFKNFFGVSPSRYRTDYIVSQKQSSSTN